MRPQVSVSPLLINHGIFCEPLHFLSLLNKPTDFFLTNSKELSSYNTMILRTYLFPFFLDHKPQPMCMGIFFQRLTFVFFLSLGGRGMGDRKGEGVDPTV